MHIYYCVKQASKENKHVRIHEEFAVVLLLFLFLFFFSFGQAPPVFQRHVGLFETYRYKRTGQIFIWNYIGNWYVFSKYLDNYCRYQYCANDTLFRNISCILRSIFQHILPKTDVTFCETTDTAHSYIKQIVNFSEINVSIDS